VAKAERLIDLEDRRVGADQFFAHQAREPPHLGR
jgi:hypothetical protein